MIPNLRFREPINADRSGLLFRSHQQGAVVKSIASDSAADRLGIEADDIITRIDSTPVTRLNIAELKRLLASDRKVVQVCWLSAQRSQCENLALASRFDQHEYEHRSAMMVKLTTRSGKALARDEPGDYLWLTGVRCI